MLTSQNEVMLVWRKSEITMLEISCVLLVLDDQILLDWGKLRLSLSHLGGCDIGRCGSVCCGGMQCVESKQIR